MARKSRKETAAVAVQEADAACRAAIYVRLSVEDTHTHSVSIETQQMIIARYLEQYPEISVYDTYIDNGATGTNFHRPGFQQMLSDIEAGHVNCVIVKDLPVWDGTPSTPAITSSSISASATSALLRSMKTSTPPPRRTLIPVSSFRCGT